MSSSGRTKLSKAFRIEDLRNELAIKNDLIALKSTYAHTSPSIINTNKQNLWDRLNQKVQVYLTSATNPMSYNRLQIVAANITGGKILDVGFGSGSLEKLLVNKTISLTGIDFSRKSVLSALRRFPQWNFKTVDIVKAWQLNNTKFDFVVSLEVLEHISPPKTLYVLGQMNKYLKSGGVLIISVPLNEGLEEMVSLGKNPNAHVRVYTPELIKAELIIAGFELVKSYELFAFGKYYKLKTLITNLFLRHIKKPNTIIVIARKP